jgi:antitoxin ParD1/3/4
MATMNVSLPEALKEFVDRKVAEASYGTASEYVRELIRRDQDRAHLRDLLLQGAKAPITGKADAEYFVGLRAGIRKRTPKAA